MEDYRQIYNPPANVIKFINLKALAISNGYLIVYHLMR